MNHIVLIAAIGLLSTTTVFAQTVSAPLIVVEDRGGDSALPYYRPLNPQPLLYEANRLSNRRHFNVMGSP